MVIAINCITVPSLVLKGKRYLGHYAAQITSPSHQRSEYIVASLSKVNMIVSNDYTRGYAQRLLLITIEFDFVFSLQRGRISLY